MARTGVQGHVQQPQGQPKLPCPCTAVPSCTPCVTRPTNAAAIPTAACAYPSRIKGATPRRLSSLTISCLTKLDGLNQQPYRPTHKLHPDLHLSSPTPPFFTAPLRSPQTPFFTALLHSPQQCTPEMGTHHPHTLHPHTPVLQNPPQSHTGTQPPPVPAPAQQQAQASQAPQVGRG